MSAPTVATRQKRLPGSAARQRRRPAALHSVFERTLHEHRNALAGWIVGLAALAMTMLAMYPTIRGNMDFSKLVKSYPKALQEMFGISDYTSGPGYLRAEIFSLMAPLLIVILAVLWGSDLTAGEEERGTIDMLLANPVSRRRIVLEKLAAMLVGVSGTTVALGIVLALGAPLVGLRIGTSQLAAVVVATATIGMLYGTVALAVGAATGRRSVARGAAVLLAVAAYLLSSLANLATWLRPARPASPWYQALGVDPIANGFMPLHLLVVLGATAACAVIAVVMFERRDLGV